MPTHVLQHTLLPTHMCACADACAGCSICLGYAEESATIVLACFCIHKAVLSMAPVCSNCNSILQRAVPEDPQFRKLLGAIVVVAANAGGAFTPIGDVTTTVCAQPLMYCGGSPAMQAGSIIDTAWVPRP